MYACAVIEGYIVPKRVKCTHSASKTPNGADGMLGLGWQHDSQSVSGGGGGGGVGRGIGGSRR